MEAVFNTTGSLLAVVVTMVALSLYVQKFKMFKMIGPALTVIIFGIILSNLSIVPFSHELYGTIGTYCIPVFISIMLFSVDIKKMLKLSKEALAATFIAIFCVSLMAVLGGVLFGKNIDEGWKIAGMFVGTYTGGSANLTAIATGLDVAPATLAAANAADYVVGIPTLFLMFASPALIKASSKFQKFWPYSVVEEDLQGDGSHEELMASKEWSIVDIAIMVSMGFVITEIATQLAALFPPMISSAARILLVTTIAIALAQTAPVKRLRGNMDLGLYISMMFLSTIGISVSITAFFGSALSITLFCFFVIIGSILLHLTITRLFKIKYQYVILSITGAIADGTTAGLVAASGGWKSLVSIGVVMGILGMAVGNYVGIGIAYLIRMIIGG